jgi:hypothetical protein
VDWATTPPEPVAGSVRVYGRYQLLRALAALTPYLDGGRTLRLPADIAPLVQEAYGDAAAGPAAWQDAIAAALADHDATQQRKERRAQTFRLGAAGSAGEAIVGWLEGGVGDVDDDPKLEGRRQVRDTAAESVEVLVLVRRADGALVTPPWLRRGGGREVPTEHQPLGDLARVVATCTLGLPIQLCRIETIEELEQRSYFPAWQGSPWLGGELVLVLEERGEVELDGHHLRYDPQDGLVVTRMDSRAAP